MLVMEHYLKLKSITHELDQSHDMDLDLILLLLHIYLAVYFKALKISYIEGKIR